MGGDGGCRVGEVRAGTTSPMPDHKGFKLQELVNFQKFSTLRVKFESPWLKGDDVFSLFPLLQNFVFPSKRKLFVAQT